jgi:hypothetical protein
LGLSSKELSSWVDAETALVVANIFYKHLEPEEKGGVHVTKGGHGFVIPGQTDFSQNTAARGFSKMTSARAAMFVVFELSSLHIRFKK